MNRVIEDWQLPNVTKQTPKSNFTRKKIDFVNKTMMVQRQGPKGMKLESDLDSRVKKIVMRGLAEFRELKVDK